MNESMQKIFKTIMNHDKAYKYFLKRHHVIAIGMAENIANLRLTNTDKKTLIKHLEQKYSQEVAEWI